MSIALSVMEAWTRGELTGDSKHALVVRIRKGYMKRQYGVPLIPLPAPPNAQSGEVTRLWAEIVGEQKGAPWQATWTPKGPWITLPNVQSAKYTKSFDQKGSSSLTVVMDNIAFPEKDGVLGTYHEIKRGFYSPSRTNPALANWRNGNRWDDTGWTDVLNGGYQIEVWEGYGEGDEVVPLATPVLMSGTWTCQPLGAKIDRTWVGLIEQSECESRPDRITITARDFGVLYTDQRLQGQNKSPVCRSPITFADRKKTNKQLKDGTLQNVQHWILTDDMADIVQVCLTWAGFKEYRITPYGWSIDNPMQYGSVKFYADVMDDAQAQGNWLYYMTAPTAWDRSIGVPEFKEQAATALAMPMGLLEINEKMMLETAQLKWDLSDLPYVFRYRGVPVPEGSKAGAQWEDSLVDTYMAAYYPPWSGGESFVLGKPKGGNHPDKTEQDFCVNRVSSVRRHFVQDLGIALRVGLESNEQCAMACVLAAMQYGLQMCTGQVQIAGIPGFELNKQVRVVDEGVGIDSRMYVSSISSDHTMGETGKWTMTIAGSYLDTEDMTKLSRTYINARTGFFPVT